MPVLWPTSCIIEYSKNSKPVLKAIIIDDELKARTNLRSLVELCDIEINVLRDFGKPSEAILFLSANHVDCIFLDVEMPEMDGFQFLELLGESNAKVIFTTAHNEYAIKALKANAIDYILKPIDIDELEESLLKLEKVTATAEPQEQNSVYQESLQNLMKGFDEGKTSTKITIPQNLGFKIVDSKNISRIEADGRYSMIYFDGEPSELVTKNIGHFEEILDADKFVRIHHSHLINLDFMAQFSNIDGGVAIMKDGGKVAIAKRRMKEFRAKVEAYYA